jgi:acyl carrier protein
MTQDEILQHVIDILVDTFELDRSTVTPTANLRDDLDIDSIDAVDLMVHLKPLVGQRLQPEAFKTVRTVGDIAVALHNLMTSTPE